MNLENLRKDLKAAISGSEFEHKVYFAGGAVRDSLLGRESGDIDICVEMPDGAVLLAEYLAQKWKLNNPVIYARFGTALLNYKGLKLELVMTRAESYRPHNRKPNVIFADLSSDVMRRDFTVNALLMEVESGNILDLSGKGLADIKRKTISCVGNPAHVFAEDPLRILRAIRFALQLGFQIDNQCRAELKLCAQHLKDISAERIAEEFNKILMMDDLPRIVALLLESSVLPVILPELCSIDANILMIHSFTQQVNNQIFWKEGKHSSYGFCESIVSSEVLNLRWAALLHNLYICSPEIPAEDHLRETTSKMRSSMIQRILLRFQIPFSDRKLIQSAIKVAEDLGKLLRSSLDIPEKKVRELLFEDRRKLYLVLHLIPVDSLATQLLALLNRLQKCHEQMPNQRFVLTGNDLISSLGIESGVLVGKLLEIAKDKWFEDPLLSREELLDYLATRIYKK